MERAVRRWAARALGRVRRVACLVRATAWAAPDRAVPLPPQVAGPGFRGLRRLVALLGVAAAVVLALTADRQLDQLVVGSLAWALAVVQVFPLLLAPTRPLSAWRISSVGMVITTFAEVGHAPAPFWPWTVSGCVAYLVMMFCAALSHGRDIAIGMDLLTGVCVLLPAVFLVGLPPVVFAVAVVAVTLVLLVGESVHSRQEAERHLVQAEQQRRQGLARQAVLEERARIARELHDVVAHHMSMIAIQAEAAPYKQPGLPEPTLRTFGAIRRASTTALTEMRRVIGLLREENEQDVQRAPQPGISSIPDMIRASRQAGMAVDLTLTAGPEPPPAVVDVSAYRIVQEALSNAGRHAPGAHVEVEIAHTADAVAIRVTDDGARDGGAPAPPAPGGSGGHGLTGMRERAGMLGGSLRAGPLEGGGFEVAAVLPLRGAAGLPAGDRAAGDRAAAAAADAGAGLAADVHAGLAAGREAVAGNAAGREAVARNAAGREAVAPDAVAPEAPGPARADRGAAGPGVPADGAEGVEVRGG